MVPANLLRMIAFYEQCQATNKVAGILDKIPKDTSSQRKRKRLIFLPHVTWIKLAPALQLQLPWPSSKQPTQLHNQHHDHGWRNDRDTRNSKSYNKKDGCKRDHFKKKGDKAMHIDQSSLSSASSSSEKWRQSWSPSRSWFVLALAQAPEATKTIVSNNMNASQAQLCMISMSSLVQVCMISTN
jgi:hypothetical protein